MSGMQKNLLRKSLLQRNPLQRILKLNLRESPYRKHP